MAADARLYAPFEAHFKMQVISYRLTQWAADRAETQLIAQYAATGPAGYNTLQGPPRTDRRFWAMAAQRKKAKK